MYIGKKLVATAALIGAAVLGGVVAAAPAATAAPLDAQGIHLVAGHNVGLYNDYNKVDNADKAGIPDLLYNNDLNVTDGIGTDCWSDRGQQVVPGHPYWYHVKYEYYNHSGVKLQRYAWAYAYYTDFDKGRNTNLVPYCNY